MHLLVRERVCMFMCVSMSVCGNQSEASTIITAGVKISVRLIMVRLLLRLLSSAQLIALSKQSILPATATATATATVTATAMCSDESRRNTLSNPYKHRTNARYQSTCLRCNYTSIS